MRVVVGIIILIMAVKVLCRNAGAIAANARVLVNLYGAQFPITGHGLGVLVVLMGAVGAGLMVLGLVGVRRLAMTRRP